MEDHGCIVMRVSTGEVVYWNSNTIQVDQLDNKESVLSAPGVCEAKGVGSGGSTSMRCVMASSAWTFALLPSNARW